MEAVFAHIEKYEPAFMRMSERPHAGRKNFYSFYAKKTLPVWQSRFLALFSRCFNKAPDKPGEPQINAVYRIA